MTVAVLDHVLSAVCPKAAEDAVDEDTADEAIALTVPPPTKT